MSKRARHSRDTDNRCQNEHHALKKSSGDGREADRPPRPGPNALPEVARVPQVAAQQAEAPTRTLPKCQPVGEEDEEELHSQLTVLLLFRDKQWDTGGLGNSGKVRFFCVAGKR